MESQTSFRRLSMNKTAVIHQPDFLSYLGFFHRFLHADVWIVLDNVQFVTGTSKSWQNRDKIKTPLGERWLTVGVKKSPMGTLIHDIELAETSWREDNLNLIRANYCAAPYFNEIMPYIEDLYALTHKKLVDFNLASACVLMDLFDIRIDMAIASEINPVGKSNDLLVDILNKTETKKYLSGMGARTYFDPAPFNNAGIEVVWQEFKHPLYPQLHGDFVPYLSSIDLLFNCGITSSREILRSCA